MLTLYFVQSIVPILLLLLMVFYRPKNACGYFSQAAFVGVGIVTLLFSGLLIIPPWWIAYLYFFIWTGIVIWQPRQIKSFESKTPANLGSWLHCGLCTALLLIMASQLVGAVRGRIAPNTIIDLNFPFESGSYLIVSGGNSASLNAHFMTLDETVPQFKNWRGQSYALDIVKINRYGLRSSGLLPSDPAEYTIYGEKLIAPCSGEVLKTENTIEDNPVPLLNREAMSGNFVLLRCHNVEVVLAHMIKGSVAVTEGEQVIVGQQLGLAGNSGNSGEPHLHLHVQALGAPENTFDSDPLPFTVAGKYWLRNQIMKVE